MRSINDKLVKLNPTQYNSPHSLFGVISSSIRVGGWDFEDDFSSDTWTDSTSNPAISTGVINYDVPPSTTLNANTTYKDMMGAIIDDNAWVLRFKDNITVYASNSDGTAHYMSAGISSTTGNYSSNQDFIGYQIANASSNNLLNQNDVDGTALFSSVGGTMVRTAQVESKFVEIVRLTATSYKMSFSSTSSYTKDIEADKTRTGMASTIQSLRYAKVSIHANDTTPNGDLTGTVDDWKFADGVTVAP